MKIPTVEEIHAKNLNDFRRELNINTIKPQSFLFIFSKVLAGALFGCYWFAHKLINNFFLDTTTDSKIVDWWGEFLDIPKNGGSLAQGKCQITGTGEVMGATLTNMNGDEYVVTYVEGNTITVESLQPGIDKNLSADKQLVFQQPVSGVEPIATSLGITGGDNEELMEEYRERIIRTSRTVRTGGNREDYIAWASEESGVGKVFVFENYGGGIGRVGITFITNDRDALIPNNLLVGKVRERIDSLRPLGSVVEVYAPTGVSIDLEIELRPDTEEVKGRVKEQIKEMLKVDAEVGGKVYYSRIGEAISKATGEESHIFTMGISGGDKGTEDIKLGVNEIAILGEIIN